MVILGIPRVSPVLELGPVLHESGTEALLGRQKAWAGIECLNLPYSKVANRSHRYESQNARC